MGAEQVKLGLDQAVETEVLSDGTRITVRRTEGAVVDQSVNGTAYHEACHALAAMILGIPVLKATDQPSAEYGGATWTLSYDPRVAAAAEAKGCDGTSHDLWTIAMMGDSPDQAVAEAASLLSGQDSELKAVATIIQRAGMASGGQMQAAESRVDFDWVEVTTENPDSTTETVTGIARNNAVNIQT